MWKKVNKYYLKYYADGSTITKYSEYDGCTYLLWMYGGSEPIGPFKNVEDAKRKHRKECRK